MNNINLSESRHTEDIEGVIDEVIAPGKEWRVRVYGIYWHAVTKGKNHFEPGQHVSVIGRKHLKLVILPIPA